LTSGSRQRVGEHYQAAASVFVRKSAPNDLLPLEGFAKLHKLTASEVRVVDAVLKASGIVAVADLLGISTATVKSHLNHIYRKSGARNQGDLIKAVTGVGR
jgi:DNA-binding CsgD family transcriptional regulator